MSVYKTIQEVTYQDQEGKVYLDAVSEKSGSGWFTELRWGRHEVQFKLDTGAEVSVVSEKTYRNVGQPALHAPDKMLFGPSHCPLQVLWCCKAMSWYRASVQTVYVVKGLTSNLLGLLAITALKLAARLEAIDDLRALWLPQALLKRRMETKVMIRHHMKCNGFTHR